MRIFISILIFFFISAQINASSLDANDKNKISKHNENPSFMNNLHMLKLSRFSSMQSLVKSVYDDVDPKLHPIAIWSLEAHLYKLLEEEIVEYKSTEKIWSFK